MQDLTPYNDTHQQRQRIEALLLKRGQAGALALEIQRFCAVPCVTKRISEMVRKGVPITKRREWVRGPHGMNDAVR